MCPSAVFACLRVFVADEERYALNSSAERRETQEPVNNSSNNVLFLHDCSSALTFITPENYSRMLENFLKLTCKELSYACSILKYAYSFMSV